MKNLTITLLLVVITAVAGFGWLITEVNFRLNNNQQLDPELIAYNRIGRDLAKVLDQSDSMELFIITWNSEATEQLVIEGLADFPVPNELRQEFLMGEPLVLESDEKVSMHFYLPVSMQVLSLSLPERAHDKNVLSLTLTIAFYTGLMMFLLLWLYPLIKRLVTLGDAAKAFGSGDLASRIDAKGISYIRDIEKEFNKMADRIESLIRDNKVLSQAVSHNLKTPLARLRFGIDVFEETQDSKAREKYMARLSHDISEMESLVETLLEYARLDSSTVEINLQKVEIKHLVLQLLEDKEEWIKEDIRIECEFPEKSVEIVTDSYYLAIQLNNLFENAIVHASSAIRVSVGVVDGKVKIGVEDDGPGVPREEWETVIQPFQQGSNTRNKQGHGMGLAIVSRIAEWLDGKLVVGESSDLGGAAMTLEFKLEFKGSE